MFFSFGDQYCEIDSRFVWSTAFRRRFSRAETLRLKAVFRTFQAFFFARTCARKRSSCAPN
jgi:hypothetical protein